MLQGVLLLLEQSSRLWLCL